MGNKGYTIPAQCGTCTLLLLLLLIIWQKGGKGKRSGKMRSRFFGSHFTEQSTAEQSTVTCQVDSSFDSTCSSVISGIKRRTRRSRRTILCCVTLFLLLYPAYLCREYNAWHDQQANNIQLLQPDIFLWHTERDRDRDHSKT
jgi:hypothetical protein